MNPQRLTSALVFAIATICAFGAKAQDKKPEYQLGSGDAIRVQIFQNPDLTVETRVTENGTISYPLVGSVKVGGMTIPAAEQTVAKALKDGGFIQSPQVNISLLLIRGNQVSVLGSVGRPGRYPLETFNTRFSEMLAIAGGIGPTGGDIAILTGLRDGKPLRKEIDVVGMFLGNRTDDDIVVAGGDIIYVIRQPMFFIYGEAQRPGTYRVERNMTIRQALVTGGGPTSRGTERNLEVYRRSAGGVVETLNPDLNDPVQPDDVLYVKSSLF